MVLIFVIILVFLWFVMLTYKNYRHLNKIPMPPCNLFAGHALYFRNADEVLSKITKLTIDYGSIIRIYFPLILPTIVVTDPKIILLLTTSEKSLEKSKYYRFLNDWLGKGLLTNTNVSEWRNNRKRLNPCIGRLTLMKNFVTIFEKKGDIFIKNLENGSDNICLDVFPIVKSFTMDVMCESFMGVSTLDHNCKQRYFKTISNLSQILVRRFMCPLKLFDCYFNITKDSQQFYEELRTVEEIFDKIMSEKSILNNGDAKVDDNLTLLDLLLQSDQFRDTNYIRDEINTFLLGGHDTTATAISFTLYALSRNPQIQEKVLDEQYHIFGSFNENLTVSYSELQDMKYLELVIKESLRMYPPIPYIGRKISSAIELDNNIILPKGLSPVIFIYGCHHNPKYFPEPEKFIPERFQNNIPSSYFPFSNGPRNCIGKKFATLQIKSCVSRVIRKFKLLPSQPDEDIKLFPSMTLTARNGIRISLQQRIQL